MRGVVALDERDGLRQHGDVAAQDALHVLLDGERPFPALLEIGIRNGLLRDAPSVTLSALWQ